ncbi:MAG TPA: type 1 glutamine amidotransferase domain-containing protein [Burkholderiaceae bacterium]|jgi:protease I
MNRHINSDSQSDSDNSASSDTANAAEHTLDEANAMTFPASDPIATSNITRITESPEMAHAASEHQNSGKIEAIRKEKKPASEKHAGHPADSLKDIKIAALVTDGFEEAELLEPKKMLEELGATVDIVADQSEGKDSIQGFKHTEKGARVQIDKNLSEAKPENYAGVLLPGGVVNGDAMRMLGKARQFVKEIDEAGKPIAAICHGGWLLISAGLARGRTVTSWPSLKDDFENAGSHWVDEESVQDGNLVTARKPADIPAFNESFISLLRRA